MTISVGLVDDQALIREGIARLIELSQVATTAWQAGNGEQALQKLSEDAVDVLLCDIRMPVMDGITLLQRLRAADNQQPVLVLTTFDDHQLFLRALGAGANGFPLKDVSLEKLIQGIRTVADGGFIAEPRLVSQVSTAVKDAPPSDAATLSKKEREILRLVAGGLSNREIADRVFLAEKTVKNYVSRILSKLHMSTRSEAAA